MSEVEKYKQWRAGFGRRSPVEDFWWSTITLKRSSYWKGAFLLGVRNFNSDREWGDKLEGKS